MQFFVYILYSPKFTRTYVGQAEDVVLRLKQHNGGRVRSTKAFAPWQVIHAEACATRSEAMARERWFKSSSGRRRIREILEETNGLSVSTVGRDEIPSRDSGTD